MPAIVITLARVAAPHRSSADVMRRAMRRLLVVLDRIVPPPHKIVPDADLPTEWFKYPPI